MGILRRKVYKWEIAKWRQKISNSFISLLDYRWRLHGVW